MPQGAARWTTRAGGGPGGGLAKDAEQCREVEVSASGRSSSVLDGMKAGASHERHHSTVRDEDREVVHRRSARTPAR